VTDGDRADRTDGGRPQRVGVRAGQGQQPGGQRAAGRLVGQPGQHGLEPAVRVDLGPAGGAVREVALGPLAVGVVQLAVDQRGQLLAQAAALHDGSCAGAGPGGPAPRAAASGPGGCGCGRSDLDAERRGDLLVRQPLEVAQHDAARKSGGRASSAACTSESKCSSS
jgi:hypothetical protein